MAQITLCVPLTLCCSAAHIFFSSLFYFSLLLSVSCYHVFSSCSFALFIFYCNTDSLSPLVPQFISLTLILSCCSVKIDFNIHEQSFLFLSSFLLSIYVDASEGIFLSCSSSTLPPEFGVPLLHTNVIIKCNEMHIESFCLFYLPSPFICPSTLPLWMFKSQLQSLSLDICHQSQAALLLSAFLVLPDPDKVELQQQPAASRE